MAQIGTFTTNDTGQFTGTIKTLTLNVKAIIRSAAKDNDKAPDFRVFAGTVEFGAAWKKTSREDRDYLSLKLDDPSFPAPIYATLIEGEDGEFPPRHGAAGFSPDRIEKKGVPDPSLPAAPRRADRRSRGPGFALAAAIGSDDHGRRDRARRQGARGQPLPQHRPGRTLCRPGRC